MLFKNLTPHFVREEPATGQQQKNGSHTILSWQLRHRMCKGTPIGKLLEDTGIRDIDKLF